MKNKLALITVLFTFGLVCLQGQAAQNQEALAEFEDSLSALRELQQSLELGTLVLPFKVQQYDDAAIEVKTNSNPQAYRSAVSDPFYGYQIFILVDKSISKVSSKMRNGSKRTAQTMYVYVREGNQLILRSVHPVSTGKETTPFQSDTREGFMRVQSAQAEYTSKKYGEAMPFSLWFESEYGTAIHETLQSRCDNLIGRRASAGCIRLCPGEAEDLFRLVTKHPRSSPIVLLDKRTGVPIARGTDRQISQSKNSQGAYLSLPKVIQGYPVMVRIVDGQNQEKIQEIESIIQNPTAGFQKYFTPISTEVIQEQLSL